MFAFTAFVAFFMPLSQDNKTCFYVLSLDSSHHLGMFSCGNDLFQDNRASFLLIVKSFIVT